MEKRGQSGTGAATLVLIIGGLIILYILFLPADVREELLEGNDSEDGRFDGEENLTLIHEEPHILVTGLDHIGLGCRKFERE